MTLNTLHVLQVAKELEAKKEPEEYTEARLRSAISRAYYAVFLEARTYLENHTSFIVGKSKYDHEGVRKAFYNKGNGEYNHIYTALDRLRPLRNNADYDETVDEIEKYGRTAKTSLERATFALSVLERMNKSANRK